MRSFYSRKDLSRIWRKLARVPVYLGTSGNQPINVIGGYEVMNFQMQNGIYSLVGSTVVRHTAVGRWVGSYGIGHWVGDYGIREIFPEWVLTGL